MKITSKSAVSAAAIAAVCFGYTPAVFAQSGDAASDVIVVTAQKREQTLLEVPINVGVADQNLIDNYNLNEVEKLADFIPGLQIQSQSVNIPTYTLRGVVSDGGPPRVALFQNGVTISDPPEGTNMALFDMERVEVVKGPQATLFGQGALVGGINFIHNRASTDGNSGYARFEYGNFNSIRGEGTLNLAVSDQFAVRVAALYKDRDGHVENLGEGPDLGGGEQLALRAAVHFAPTDRITADLIFNYQDDSTTGTPFQSGYLSPDGGPVDLFGPVFHGLSDDQLAVRDYSGVDREIIAITGDIAFELTDALTLTSLTDYREIDTQDVFDADATEFDILQFIGDSRNTVFSQELRLNYDAGDRLSGFIGVNYFDRDTTALTEISSDLPHLQAVFARDTAAAFSLDVPTFEGALFGVIGADAFNFDDVRDPLLIAGATALLTSFSGPPTVIPLNRRHLERATTTSARTSYDLFADVSYEVTDRLTLTAGARLTQEDISISTFGELARGNPLLGGVANAADFGTTLIIFDNNSVGAPSARSETPDAAVTWRFNAAYRVSDDLNIWAAQGRGRRADVFSVNAADVDLIEAELLDNYEIGLFGRFFDGRAQVSSSVYYSEYTNFQTEFFDEATGQSVVANAGNATQYGFEMDGQYSLTDNIRLLATYAYNFSEFDDTDGSGNELEFAGNTFRLSPRNSFSIAADISVPVSSVGTISIFPSYVWRSRQFFEDDNSLDISADGMGSFTRVPETFLTGDVVNEFQDAYGELDIKVSFEHASERWTAYMFAENLTDAEFLIDGGNTGGNIGDQHTFIRGLPRTFGGGITVKF